MNKGVHVLFETRGKPECGVGQFLKAASSASLGRFEMEISSIKPSGYAVQQPASPHPDQAAYRRQLTEAVRTVNDSGALGNNEMVFSVDRQTHRPVVRVIDKETHEVIFQAPPDYVLNLAERLGGGSAQE